VVIPLGRGDVIRLTTLPVTLIVPRLTPDWPPRQAARDEGGRGRNAGEPQQNADSGYVERPREVEEEDVGVRADGHVGREVVGAGGDHAEVGQQQLDVRAEQTEVRAKGVETRREDGQVFEERRQIPGGGGSVRGGVGT